MKNDYAEELEAMIPSETVRKYVMETGWTFTDREKAILLMMSDIPLKEQHARLRALRDNTEDSVLKERLTQYLDSEDKGIRELKENADRRYIYVLKLCDSAERDYYTVGYFYDYDAAYKCGLKKYQELKLYSFEVEKYLIQETPEEDKCRVAEIRFKNGKDYTFSAYDPDYDYRYFEAYFEVPNPFERGDIVKIDCRGTEEYGIVETSQKEWKEDVKRFSVNEDGVLPNDITDIIINVAIPDSDGIFSNYYHISPLELERYQPNPNYTFENVTLDAILLEASKVYKGEGCLYNLYFLAEKYKSNSQK